MRNRVRGTKFISLFNFFLIHSFVQLLIPFVCHLINIITEYIWVLLCENFRARKWSLVSGTIDSYMSWLAKPSFDWNETVCVRMPCLHELNAIKNTYGDLTNVICVHKWISLFRLLLKHARMPRCTFAYQSMYIICVFVCQC